MQDFIFEANISRCKELLTITTDVGKVTALQKLLAEEKAKLAHWHSLQAFSR